MINLSINTRAHTWLFRNISLFECPLNDYIQLINLPLEFILIGFYLYHLEVSFFFPLSLSLFLCKKISFWLKWSETDSYLLNLNFTRIVVGHNMSVSKEITSTKHLNTNYNIKLDILILWIKKYYLVGYMYVIFV